MPALVNGESRILENFKTFTNDKNSFFILSKNPYFEISNADNLNYSLKFELEESLIKHMLSGNNKRVKGAPVYLIISSTVGHSCRLDAMSVKFRSQARGIFKFTRI